MNSYDPVLFLLFAGNYLCCFLKSQVKEHCQERLMKMPDNGRHNSRICHRNECTVNKGSITGPGTDHFTNGTHTGSGPGPELYVVCVSHVSAPERLMIWCPKAIFCKHLFSVYFGEKLSTVKSSAARLTYPISKSKPVQLGRPTPWSPFRHHLSLPTNIVLPQRRVLGNTVVSSSIIFLVINFLC